MCSQRPLRLCARCYKAYIADEAEGARTRLLSLPIFAICGVALVWFTTNLLTIFAAILPSWVRLLASDHGLMLMPFVAAWCAGCAYGTILIGRTGLCDALWLPPPFKASTTAALGGLLIGGLCLPFGVAADFGILRFARDLHRAAPPMRNVTLLSLPRPHLPPRRG